MKIKLAAYAAAAVLIGFAVMMLPLALETGPPSYDPRQAPSAYTSSSGEGGNEPRTMPDSAYGLTFTPYNILPSGLILLAGLAAALAAYVVRRQLK